jgi:hypothetical protein
MTISNSSGGTLTVTSTGTVQGFSGTKVYAVSYTPYVTIINQGDTNIIIQSIDTYNESMTRPTVRVGGSYYSCSEDVPGDRVFPGCHDRDLGQPAMWPFPASSPTKRAHVTITWTGETGGNLTGGAPMKGGQAVASSGRMPLM